MLEHLSCALDEAEREVAQRAATLEHIVANDAITRQQRFAEWTIAQQAYIDAREQLEALEQFEERLMSAGLR